MLDQTGKFRQSGLQRCRSSWAKQVSTGDQSNRHVPSEDLDGQVSVADISLNSVEGAFYVRNRSYRDSDGALEYAKHTISDLLCNKVDISQLVITKELTKTDEESKQPEVQLYHKMYKRDAKTAPKLGDRVAYVIIASGPKTPLYRKVKFSFE